MNVLKIRIREREGGSWPVDLTLSRDGTLTDKDEKVVLRPPDNF